MFRSQTILCTLAFLLMAPLFAYAQYFCVIKGTFKWGENGRSPHNVLVTVLVEGKAYRSEFTDTSGYFEMNITIEQNYELMFTCYGEFLRCNMEFKGREKTMEFDGQNMPYNHQCFDQWMITALSTNTVSLDEVLRKWTQNRLVLYYDYFSGATRREMDSLAFRYGFKVQLYDKQKKAEQEKIHEKNMNILKERFGPGWFVQYILDVELFVESKSRMKTR
jgi:hypothetical protein